MENSEISVTQALNKIQSWLNAGEFEKVIQGSQEILEIEPGNQRALALLKQANEGRHSAENEPVQPAEPESKEGQEFTTLHDTESDPIEKLKVEKEPDMFETEVKMPAQPEKRKLFLAMLIPAVLVVLIGGGIIWVLSNNQREDNITASITDIETDSSYLDENEERVENLNKIAQLLENYKATNGAYPSFQQVSAVITADEDFDKVPVDPKQGEFDKSGKAFGYMYALYETSEGENTAFILSALFEDSKGFGYAWTEGVSTKNYPDYRDINEDHVNFLGDFTSEEVESSGPKVKVKR